MSMDGFLRIAGIELYPAWIWPLVALSAACALVYLLWFCYRGPSGWKTAIKTASVGLLALAVLSTLSPQISGPWLALALGLCAAGDFFLSRDGERAFLAGVVSFAAGHVAYVVVFLGHAQSEPSLLARADVLAVIAALVVFGGAMIVALFPRTGDLRWAVSAYVPVILLMFASAITVTGAGPRAWVLPAAAAFLVSDSLLASEMFLLRAGHPLRRITPFLIWGLYWLAQFGFFVALGWGVGK